MTEKGRTENLEKRRREMDNKSRLWREDILPNWETLKTQSEKCGSSFIWGILAKNILEGYLLGGIPPNARGEAWRRLINISGVQLSEEDFQLTKAEICARYSSEVRTNENKSDPPAPQVRSVPRVDLIVNEQFDEDHPLYRKTTTIPQDIVNDESPPVTITLPTDGTRPELMEKVEKPELLLLDQARQQILRDIPRTYTTLGFLHDDSHQISKAFEIVLLVYARTHPDKGYAQGMSFLAASFLLYMDEYNAYSCLSAIVSSGVISAFLTMDMHTVKTYVLCFKKLFKKMLPALFSHFETEMVSCESFLMDWVMSLFTKALPLEVAMCVWDMFFFTGEVYILRAALGLLTFAQEILLRKQHDQIMSFLLKFDCKSADTSELINTIHKVKISQSEYDRLFKGLK